MDHDNKDADRQKASNDLDERRGQRGQTQYGQMPRDTAADKASPKPKPAAKQ